MNIRNRWRKITSGLVVVAAVGLFVSNPSGTETDPSEPAPLIVDLNGPRGVAVGPLGLLAYTENDGSFSALVTKGPFAGTIAPLGSIPPNFIAPAIAMGNFGQTFILSAGTPEGQETPAPGSATLYKWLPGAQSPRPVADIAAYQATDPDPYNTNGPPEESNPFGVALLPDGSVLVSDAAANDLLRVYRNGKIVTVARLKPRVVAVPDELPDVGFPPAGAMLPSEAVATSVTVGADGYYYVGELRGFPATPGKSQVWRIKPDSVNAVCDPEAPRKGNCQRYADGFTSIVALGAGDDGSIYVVELVKQSWLQWELGLVVGPPVGGLFRIPRGGGAATELAADQLILPAGVAVAGSKSVYVTGPVFGPGNLSRIRVPFDHHGR